MLIEPITQDDWVINGWKICFSLHDKLQIIIDRSAATKNWYEDKVIEQVWIERLTICLYSIRRFYTEFGYLPQVGDRLYDHDTGLLIHERAIDGHLGEITFIISV